MQTNKREEVFLFYCLECGTVQVQGERSIQLTFCKVCHKITEFAFVAIDFKTRQFFTIIS